MAKILTRLQNFWRSFWALPVLYMLLAALVFTVMSLIDHHGASAWLARQPWPFSISGDTALEAVSSLITVIVSLVALFFSITLIVMTMAASNLGVRLIDRWVNDISIRVTLSLLLGLLIYALMLQAAIDPAGPDERLPRLSLLTLIGGLALSLLWLAKAFDHLSRRIHVDTSIADLGADLGKNLQALAYLSTPAVAAPEWDGGHHYRSPRSGYVDGVYVADLVKAAAAAGLTLCVPVRLGEYVHAGDVLIRAVGGDQTRQKDDLLRHIRLSEWRSDRQGAPFEAALLAEIAARALSPALNDVYTALDCIDHLGGGMAKAFANQHSEGWFGAGSDDDEASDGPGPRLFAPHLVPREVLRRPLDILRQATAPYPSASIRLLDMMGRLIRKATADREREWLAVEARLIASSALAQTEGENDRDDIQQALREALSGLYGSSD